jgi:trimeric autotransporter adhesin
MKSSFFASIIVILSLISVGVPVLADAPQLLNYQGRLTDTNGNPLNGSYSIQFLIYNDPAAGTTIWSEAHGTVNVTDGVYQVLLGSVTPFPPDLFTASIDRYLELIVAGETLTPRTRFTSVSYALQSMHSDSANVAASAISANFAAPAGIAGGDLNGSYPNPTIDGIQGRSVASTAPTADQVLKWTGSAWAPADDVAGGGSVWQTSGSNIYYNTGNVGIGKTNPATPLDVTGTITATTFAGSGASLTALNASNISSGSIGSAYLPTTLQPNRVIASDYIIANGGLHVGSSTDPGTDNLIVDGSTGLGVTPSAVPLHIKAITDYGIRFEEDGTGTEYFDMGIDNSGNLEFRTDAGNLAMTLENATGHVGINTDPAYPLHLYTGTTSSRGLFIDHNGYATGSTYGLYIDHDNAGSGLTYGGYIDVTNTSTVDSWAYGLALNTTNNGGTYGAQGIQSNVDGTSTGNKYGVYGSASGSGECYGIRGTAGGSAINYGGWFSAQSGIENFGIYATGDKHYFGGNVGIGTNTSLYPLHIVPGTATRGIYIDYNQTGNLFTYGIDLRLVNTGTNITYGGYFSVTNDNGSANTYGVRGSAIGTSTGNKYGVYGYAAGNGTTYAGYFSGNVHVSGLLSKSAGSFKIDHPLDPANKYLIHSFVESPDMMNVYNGNIVLDNNGEAIVELPNYFGILNKDFRYQLTCIGGFAQVYIAEKVNNNRFKIAGGSPGLEVSWQVTGIRNDAYAQKNRIKVEEEKVGNDRGKYLNPEVFGMPRTSAIDYDPAEEE